MNAYQKIVDTALYYSNKRTNKDQRFEPTKKDGILNRILEQIEWMNRVPGSVEKKKPYMNQLWKIYLNAQQNNTDDTTITFNENITYLDDYSIADSGIGTGGLGYSSVRSADMGTAFRNKPADKYFHKYPKSKCRTLEGDEKIQAYKEYKKNVSSV